MLISNIYSIKDKMKHRNSTALHFFDNNYPLFNENEMKSSSCNSLFYFGTEEIGVCVMQTVKYLS